MGFSLSYGIGRSLLGYFFDGKNIKKIISALLVLSGFIAIAIGLLLAVEGRSLSFLFTLWTLNGLAQATGDPCSYSTIIRWTPIANRAKYLGWFNISHNVGGALAGILASWAANVFFDGHVRGMFITPDFVVYVVGVITLFIGKGDPKEAVFDVEFRSYVSTIYISIY